MRAISVDASLADQVFEAVREAITTGELVPGELYSVYQLAAELGVSRTPVREACVRLAHTGMVRFERNRGIRVRQAGVADIRELFQLRLLLEPPAVRRAASRADPDVVRLLGTELAGMRSASTGAGDEPTFMAHDRRFHEVLLAGAGNGRLVAIVRELRDATSTRGGSTVSRSRTLADVAAEHEAILDAVRAGDPAAAESAVAAHLRHTGSLLLAQVAAETGEPAPESPWWPEIAPPAP